MVVGDVRSGDCRSDGGYLASSYLQHLMPLCLAGPPELGRPGVAHQAAPGLVRLHSTSSRQSDQGSKHYRSIIYWTYWANPHTIEKAMSDDGVGGGGGIALLLLQLLVVMMIMMMMESEVVVVVH